MEWFFQLLFFKELWCGDGASPRGPTGICIRQSPRLTSQNIRPCDFRTTVESHEKHNFTIAMNCWWVHFLTTFQLMDASCVGISCENALCRNLSERNGLIRFVSRIIALCVSLCYLRSRQFIAKSDDWLCWVIEDDERSVSVLYRLLPTVSIAAPFFYIASFGLKPQAVSRCFLPLVTVLWTTFRVKRVFRTLVFCSCFASSRSRCIEAKSCHVVSWLATHHSFRSSRSWTQIQVSRQLVNSQNHGFYDSWVNCDFACLVKQLGTLLASLWMILPSLER